MKTLLKFELRRLIRKKSFYVCMGIMVGLVALSTLVINLLVMPEFYPDLSTSLLNGLANSSFGLVAGIFAVLFVSEDFAEQTVRSVYAKGYTREKVYFAKLITTLIATTIAFFVVEISAVLCGALLLSSEGVMEARLFGVIGVQYVVTLAEVTLAFMASIVLKKNSNAIVAIIAAPVLMSLALEIIDLVAMIKEFTLASLWLSNFGTALVTLEVEQSRLITCLVGSLIYIVIFGAIGLLFNKRREI